jgi:putative PIN family toxin of toxin-antitoxin system
MIRAVLDANVFISSVLNPAGSPGRILDLARQGKFELLASPRILAEVEAVLSYPKLTALHRKSPQWIKEFMRELKLMAEISPGQLKINAITADPSDNIYLACAVEAQADYIVSGDHHLKDLKIFQGIPILDPAAFLSMLDASVETEA